VRQGFEGNNDKHQAVLFVNDVLDYQRRDGPNEHGLAYLLQLPERLAKLGVEAKASVDLLDCLQNLFSETQGLCPTKEIHKRTTNPFRVNNPIRHGAWTRGGAGPAVR